MSTSLPKSNWMSMEGKKEDKEGERRSPWGSERPRKPDEDMVSYLSTVSGALDSKLEPKERRLLVANVFREISKHEVSLSGNKKCSFVVEQILKESHSSAVVQRFLFNARQYFGWLAYNRFGSHVLQTLFSVIHKALHREIESGDDSGAKDNEEEEESDDDQQEEEEEQDLPSLEDMLEDLVSRLLVTEEWWSMMIDKSATHVVRSMICVLAGQDPSVRLKKDSGKGENRRYHGLLETTAQHDAVEKRGINSKKLRRALNSMLVECSRWDPKEIRDVAKDPNASPVLQLLLENCSSTLNAKAKHKEKNNSRAWETTVNKLLDFEQGKCSQAFNELVRDHISSHLMQVVVRACSKTYFSSVIFEQCLRSNLKELCSHRVANYVVQHALTSISTIEEARTCVEELEEDIGQSLLCNHLGVVWRLCEVCEPYPDLQKRLCKAVLRGVRARHASQAGHGSTSPSNVHTVAKLVGLIKENENETKESDVDDNDVSLKPSAKVNVSVLGVLIVRSLMVYEGENSRAVWEGIASMDHESLVKLCTDPVAGKHMMEPFMEAPSPTKSWARQQVLATLQKQENAISTLASNRFGHFVILKAFDNGSFRDKLAIVKSLLKGTRRLNGSKYGMKVYNHCKVQLYKKHPDHWTSAVKHQSLPASSQTSSNKRKAAQAWLGEIEKASPSEQRKTTKKKRSNS